MSKFTRRASLASYMQATISTKPETEASEMDPTIVTATVVIAGHGMSLLAQALRQRAQHHQQHASHRFLLAVAQALPSGSKVYEQRADGTSITLAVAPTRPAGHTHG
jgi:hypothetical protein